MWARLTLYYELSLSISMGRPGLVLMKSTVEIQLFDAHWPSGEFIIEQSKPSKDTQDKEGSPSGRWFSQ